MHGVFRRNERGATAAEFALLSPILMVMFAGISGYGGYFWVSHSIQELANDSARAALAGLNSDERTSLAQAAEQSEVSTYPTLDPARTSVSVSGDVNQLTVSVSYDASNSPFWALKGLAPMPSTTIVRQATIRLGGY
jgi:Flp pilus assembly protein TadG